MTEQTEGAEGTIDGVPFTYEQTKIVAAREAAAEVRGAQAVLAAVEAVPFVQTETYRQGWRDCAARAAAAAAGGGA